MNIQRFFTEIAVTKIEERPKPGRKPLSHNEKKQTVTTTLSPKIIFRLREDAKNGKAISFNQMIARIIERHYRKIDKKIKDSTKPPL